MEARPTWIYLASIDFPFWRCAEIMGCSERTARQRLRQAHDAIDGRGDRFDGSLQIAADACEAELRDVAVGVVVAPRPGRDRFARNVMSHDSAHVTGGRYRYVAVPGFEGGRCPELAARE